MRILRKLFSTLMLLWTIYPIVLAVQAYANESQRSKRTVTHHHKRHKKLH